MPTNATVLTRLLLNERPSLLRLAQRIVGTVQAAEDVTQSLWLRVQRVEDDPPIINKRAYLYRLAANLATDHARSDRRYGLTFESGDLPEGVPDEQPSPEQALIDRQRVAIMVAALAELPPRTREVFRMRKVEGIAISAIAEHFGLSRSSVAKMMQAALIHCDAKLHDGRE